MHGQLVVLHYVHITITCWLLLDQSRQQYCCTAAVAAVFQQQTCNQPLHVTRAIILKLLCLHLFCAR